MPRIDPVQLLRCLSVLLSPNGGIKSTDEVKRLATLMLRFSKKLVSKCIYIQILKSTETEVLGSFMGAGGWSLTLGWIDESIVAKNWALVQEILELLFLCPVDVERLKTNTFPKRVKGLSKEGNHPGVQFLASKLVERWLKVVKGEFVPPLQISQIPVPLVNGICEINSSLVKEEIENISEALKNSDSDESANKELHVDSNTETDLEICSDKDKNISEISHDVSSVNITENNVDSSVSPESEEYLAKSDKKNSSHHLSSSKKTDLEKSHREKDSDKNNSKSDRSRSSSRSSSSQHSSHKSSGHSSHRSSEHSKKDHDSSRDKDSKKSKHSDKEKDKHHDRAKDKDKHKERDSRSKDRHRSKTHHDKKSKDKESSEKTKDKITNDKPPSIHDIGKIPKKRSESLDSNDLKKDKPSISIEIRKPNDPNRPKTVKMFHSKFRSHGLEEEAKPPPPRGLVKKPSTPPAVSGQAPKRPSPIRSTDVPPEKKAKFLESVEKPGAIKLIPAKPKPVYLQESGSFMDALTASATNKKEPKRRKRKLSASKDTSQNESSPPTSPSGNSGQSPSSPTAESPKPALRFYQDTLETEEESKPTPVDPAPLPKKTEDESASITMKSPLLSPPRTTSVSEEVEESIKIEISQNDKVNEEISVTGNFKGVLCLHKKTGPKKSVRWRETSLEEVKYFELDENERVNVTKTFLDMKQMERVHERESFQKARNLANDDLMEEKVSWRILIPIDAPEIQYGKNSKEKDIQLAREKSVLPCLYFQKSMIPDSPSEPDNENHPTTDPVIIPVDDLSGSTDNIFDYQHTPWPEPKLNPVPTLSTGMPAPNMYNPLPPFGAGFPNPPMVAPGFQPVPGVGLCDWPINVPGMMMPEGMAMPAEMFMGPNAGPGPMFQGQMGGEFPMMDGMNMNGPMFPQVFPGPMGHLPPNGPGLNRPMGPPGPGGPVGPPGVPFNFGGNRGGGSSVRGQGPNRGGHWRGKGPGNWNGPPRGGSNHRGNSRLCSHFQKKGFCRQGDKCLFLHPGVNCPY